MLSVHSSIYDQSFAKDEENFGSIFKLSSRDNKLSEKPFASVKIRYDSPPSFWYLNQDVSNSLL